MNWFLKFLAPVQGLFKFAVENFITIETSDDDVTMAAQDGSLVSYLKVDGSRQVIGDEEYAHIVEGATIKIGARFDRQGHAMQIYFVRDPENIRSYLELKIKPSRIAAENVGLNVRDVLDERVSNLSRFLSYEECYVVLWTRPSALTKSEMDRAAKESKQKKWINADKGSIRLRRWMRCGRGIKVLYHP